MGSNRNRNRNRLDNFKSSRNRNRNSLCQFLSNRNRNSNRLHQIDPNPGPSYPQPLRRSSDLALKHALVTLIKVSMPIDVDSYAAHIIFPSI